MRHMDFVFRAVLVLVPVILSLAVHEYAHALVADSLGDDTPRLMGRLTLNPASHVDLVGSILIPLLGMFTGFYFGWAKPVMVNPVRIRRSIRMGTGHMLIAVAGPLANLLLVLLAVLLYVLGKHVLGSLFPEPLLALLGSLAWINLILALFNLLPIPPLDGSRLLLWLLPHSAERLAHSFQVVAPIIFIAIVFKGSVVLTPLIGGMVQGLDWITLGQTSALLHPFLHPAAAGLG